MTHLAGALDNLAYTQTCQQIGIKSSECYSQSCFNDAKVREA